MDGQDEDLVDVGLYDDGAGCPALEYSRLFGQPVGPPFCLVHLAEGCSGVRCAADVPACKLTSLVAAGFNKGLWQVPEADAGSSASGPTAPSVGRRGAVEVLAGAQRYRPTRD
ncbi:hypothetical protein OG612_01455 [Streptomyces sp. NBC_01527]|uniref:hypothetical protein n=1 Tax=Streptomyces sp. NBC_01527 TaxID=2903894 RepID=UPI003867E483